MQVLNKVCIEGKMIETNNKFYKFKFVNILFGVKNSWSVVELSDTVWYNHGQSHFLFISSSPHGRQFHTHPLFYD